MKRRGLFLVLGLGLLALLAACGGDDATPTPTATAPAPTATSPAPTATATATPEPTVSPEDVVIIALNEQNASGQQGLAILTAMGSQTKVELTLTSGTMVSGLVHIHSGSCGADTLGGVEIGLTDFADGMSISLVDATLASLRNGDRAINAHNIDDASVYTACGDIPTEADSITIALDEQNDSGQSGWATLTTRGVQTEVALKVLPGAMVSKLVHIHGDQADGSKGSCGNDTLGDVAIGLTDIADGWSTSLVDATLASLRNEDRAINAHNIDDAAVYTACGNIPA